MSHVTFFNASFLIINDEILETCLPLPDKYLPAFSKQFLNSICICLFVLFFSVAVATREFFSKLTWLLVIAKDFFYSKLSDIPPATFNNLLILLLLFSYHELFFYLLTLIKVTSIFACNNKVSTKVCIATEIQYKTNFDFIFVE